MGVVVTPVLVSQSRTLIPVTVVLWKKPWTSKPPWAAGTTGVLPLRRAT